VGRSILFPGRAVQTPAIRGTLLCVAPIPRARHPFDLSAFLNVAPKKTLQKPKELGIGHYEHVREIMPEFFRSSAGKPRSVNGAREKAMPENPARCFAVGARAAICRRDGWTFAGADVSFEWQGRILILNR
jgi:hypothetical protein